MVVVCRLLLLVCCKFSHLTQNYLWRVFAQHCQRQLQLGETADLPGSLRTLKSSERLTAVTAVTAQVPEPGLQHPHFCVLLIMTLKC
jgi:hypothetical protein